MTKMAFYVDCFARGTESEFGGGNEGEEKREGGCWFRTVGTAFQLKAACQNLATDCVGKGKFSVKKQNYTSNNSLKVL